MIKEIQEYLKVLNELRNQMKSQLEGLPQEAIDWSPIGGEGDLSTNSLGVIATHAAGSETSLMRQFIGGQTIERDRDAEFATKGVSVSELKKRLDASSRAAEEILSPLAEAQLGEGRKWRDIMVSVRWCILHDIEHMALHVGHMQLTRQLWKAAHQ